jgi:amino acid adenylation domain-containing protein
MSDMPLPHREAAEAMTPAETVMFPLSSAQERIWTMEQLVPGSSAYHLPVAVRLSGSLDMPALSRAFSAVIARHEALRTTFAEVQGQVVQVVSAEVSFSVEIRDVPDAEAPDDLAAVLTAEAGRPFDLARGPLLRACLFRLAPCEHVLAITLHHLISDTWSVGILIREVTAHYAAGLTQAPPDLPDLPLQYGDVVVWQRDRADELAQERLSAHWRERLAGAPSVLDLPLSGPRPARRRLAGGSAPVEIAADTGRAIRRLAQECEATPFMVVLAALKVVLSRYCDTEDVVVATGVSTRTPQTYDIIGCFINVLPLRTSLAGNPLFRELVGWVRETTLTAFDHQDLPFERIVAALKQPPTLSYQALAQAIFVLQNAPVPVIGLPGLDVSPVWIARRAAQVDLNLQLWEEPDGRLSGFLEYDEDILTEATAQRLATHLKTVISAAVLRPDDHLADLPLLTDDEQSRAIVTWNASRAEFPADLCVHQLFERQAALTPEGAAIISPNHVTTYRELDAAAADLAARLSAAGVGPDRLAWILLPRSVGQIIAVLGVLKAGGAYLPVDPGYPRDRLTFMLADSRPAAVVTEPGLAEHLPDGAAHVLWVHGEPQPAPPPGPQVRPDNLAYVIYTSGSTGKPKGIAVTHRGVVNNITDLNRIGNVGSSDRVLALSSPSFDMSVYETLGTLAAGGAIVVFEASQADDPRHWVDLMTRHRVSVWNSAPALGDAMIAAAEDAGQLLPALRLAYFGGDWLPVELPDRLRALAPGVRVLVYYGATELSIHSTQYEVDRVPAGWTSIPAGRPMANQQAFVLDRGAHIVPAGVSGEIFLGGVGLSRGYANQPGLTAQRFVPHPLAGLGEVPAGSRIYRTGDVGRYKADGVVELLGRSDQQAKIRGFRVEPAEVAAAMSAHPEVCEAAVTVDRTHATSPRLLGYYVPRGDSGPDTSQLRAHLARLLPEWMIPSFFVPVPVLPLSPNGKVDVSQLPSPVPKRGLAGTDYLAPRTDVERSIAAIWAMVLLDGGEPGVQDDFFERGGHSLLAMRLVAQLRAVFDLDIALSDLFQVRTIAAQAELLEALGTASGLDVPAIAALVVRVGQLTDEQAQDMLTDQGVVVQ